MSYQQPYYDPPEPPGHAPYSRPEPLPYIRHSQKPSPLGIAGAIIILIGTIMMSIPWFYFASLPSDYDDLTYQVMNALQGVGWLLIGIGILLAVFGLSKNIMLSK